MSTPVSLVDAIAALPPDIQIVISAARLSALMHNAITDFGPPEMSTVQAARLIGRSPKFWRTAADAGEIDGAYKDDRENGTGRWRLPAESPSVPMIVRHRTPKRLM